MKTQIGERRGKAVIDKEYLLSGTEIKQVQLKLLHVLHDYCEEKGSKYYLAAGILLGAVRHKG